MKNPYRSAATSPPSSPTGTASVDPLTATVFSVGDATKPARDNTPPPCRAALFLFGAGFYVGGDVRLGHAESPCDGQRMAVPSTARVPLSVSGLG